MQKPSVSFLQKTLGLNGKGPLRPKRCYGCEGNALPCMKAFPFACRKCVETFLIGSRQIKRPVVFSPSSSSAPEIIPSVAHPSLVLEPSPPRE